MSLSEPPLLSSPLSCRKKMTLTRFAVDQSPDLTILAQNTFSYRTDAIFFYKAVPHLLVLYLENWREKTR